MGTWAFKDPSTGKIVESPVKVRNSATKLQLNSLRSADAMQAQQQHAALTPRDKVDYNELVRYKRLVQRLQYSHL